MKRGDWYKTKDIVQMVWLFFTHVYTCKAHLHVSSTALICTSVRVFSSFGERTTRSGERMREIFGLVC